ncbi:MAG TPA: DUF3300 domain-containing protein [Thermodesulfobacteriota bacterium]|nr:DUF3300 domain-containing protein [Thermodesulfobacteriota bacterium]
MKRKLFYWTAWLLVLLLAAPPWVIAQGTQGTQQSNRFKQEELDQMLAPIALYPDDLLAQILMASTYPLEIVLAARWAKQNKDLKGDALTEALEKQDWDPSVKSLVNFPDVLDRMSENSQWTQKLGDALLAQEKQVMDTIQMLRRKAQEAGNLKDNPQQKVVVEQETIVIQSTNPEVIYVPSYDPAVVYGGWWWPAFPPPLPFFPFFPYATPYAYGAMAFGMGLATSAAWGYAWGNCNWGGGDIAINNSKNMNINKNIDRGKYARQQPAGGQGKWQHDASHRKGASYRDNKTGQKYGRGSSSNAIQSREAFRGRAEQGRQDLSRGGGDRGSFDRGGRGGQATASQRGGRGGQPSVSQRGDRNSAFGGSYRGSEARQQSSRGSSSRGSSGSRGGGSSGGGGRGGGGGGRR